MKKLKVTVADGYEKDFINFCDYHGIWYRQYPEPLITRFAVEKERRPTYDVLSYILKCEEILLATMV